MTLKTKEDFLSLFTLQNTLESIVIVKFCIRKKPSLALLEDPPHFHTANTSMCILPDISPCI